MPVNVVSNKVQPSFRNNAAIKCCECVAPQDGRPLEIVVLNLMADKIATELQLMACLSKTTVEVRVTFVGTERYVQDIKAGRRENGNTSADDIRRYYSTLSDIKERKFDGLIVSGVNGLQPRVSDEIFWEEVRNFFLWSETNVISSLFLCWGAKAALKHFHDIESVKGKKKIFGLFDHWCVNDTTGLLTGLPKSPDFIPIPVSRWRSPDPDAIAACQTLEVVAESEVGPGILIEPALCDAGLYPFRVYCLAHPEYDPETLLCEYERDRKTGSNTPLPRYYLLNDHTQKPFGSWKKAADRFYSNWLNSILHARSCALYRERSHAPHIPNLAGGAHYLVSRLIV